MRSKLFFALALPVPFALFVACGSGTDTGNSSGNDDGSDASSGADIGSPTEHDGSPSDAGTKPTGDGAVVTTDSGTKDAAPKGDGGSGKTAGGDCIGNGGDPMFGYDFQCQTGTVFSSSPCDAGQNDCTGANMCCFTDPTSACVQANGPQCVTLTGF